MRFNPTVDVSTKQSVLLPISNRADYGYDVGYGLLQDYHFSGLCIITCLDFIEVSA